MQIEIKRDKITGQIVDGIYKFGKLKPNTHYKLFICCDGVDMKNIKLELCPSNELPKSKFFRCERIYITDKFGHIITKSIMDELLWYKVSNMLGVNKKLD